MSASCSILTLSMLELRVAREKEREKFAVFWHLACWFGRSVLGCITSASCPMLHCQSVSLESLEGREEKNCSFLACGLLVWVLWRLYNVRQLLYTYTVNASA